ncbi:MAG: hypothetical protein QGG67_12595 [Gammaproteobacteria bacterium]|jgi:hypothetical protein|nr:hypothetical protein [Gammaproteobacteria bacterium]
MESQEEVELLVGEYNQMLIYSEKLFSHYFSVLYFFGAVFIALFYLFIKEHESISKILFPETKPKFPLALLVFPSILLFFESGMALWLYMNKELWMARNYMSELGEKISNEYLSSNGYYFFSEYVWRDTQLYSSKYHFNLWLNFIIAIFLAFLLILVLTAQHKVINHTPNNSPGYRKKYFYLGITYIPLIIGSIIAIPVYIFS